MTPNSKVIGLGMSVNQDSAILDYLNRSVHNDVTIVYEQANVRSIVEIYVATDPNVTPGGEVAVATTKPGAGAMDLSAITGDTALDAALKAAGPNQVIYNGTVKAVSGWVHSNADELLYFPFNVKTASKGATLSIWSGDDCMYYETITDTVANAWTQNQGHYFGVNFTKRPTGSTATVHKALPAGTYTFQIVDSTGAELSSGSFTITSR